MLNSFSNFPAPKDFNDWQSWAATLVKVLEDTNLGAINLPVYVISEEKPRKGFPPAEKGDMIWINEGGVRKLAIWDGSTWIRYVPEK